MKFAHLSILRLGFSLLLSAYLLRTLSAHSAHLNNGRRRGKKSQSLKWTILRPMHFLKVVGSGHQATMAVSRVTKQDFPSIGLSSVLTRQLGWQFGRLSDEVPILIYAEEGAPTFLLSILSFLIDSLGL
ncbi:uncharacterized protein C8R40DRAFT_388487 [Lentinula edodes]|uniref:uncharacterized protein n=1 Tax=Lentinula edodes TaxID=5353 RepID=UPI001E8CBD75|nr:uncharacterized protein C8R40DRAFT_388487 [Lentinula edodes]KAH7873447.1 hypothetical protein C8R40DRAFT_388487 [Lentinula edodes]